MPTWKFKPAGEGFPQYYFLCSACDEELAAGLSAGGWSKTRGGEPVLCNSCATKCALMTEGLWGADEETRLSTCARCPHYEPCFFKGRHFC